MIIFSLPIILISTDKINRKQKPVQQPINLPPAKARLCGKNKVGKNINDINIIPEKKIISSLKEIGKTDYLTIWLPNEYFGNIWLESLEVKPQAYLLL